MAVKVGLVLAFVPLIGCSSSSSPNDGGAGGGGGGAGGAGQLGLVQCRTTDDCPSQEQPPSAGGCFANKPGGVCTRCDIRMACPAGTECIADPVDTMVCARPCTTDASCNPGMFCNASGFCQQRSCGDGGSCPAPYACRNDSCVRPPCGDDAGTCPAPLVCGGAGFCVEP
jgi:hypothetical protein